jgi:CO/xanthine dehydrogenase FAD-binding subunit
MDLHTVETLLRPTAPGQVTGWTPGHAWLAGGTWLFSEPQVATRTLVDLAGLGWTPLEVDAEGLTIAATCRIAEIAHFAGPTDWKAIPLFRQCCDSFLASFKIWNAATTGGNIVMSLPAGPMIALTAALDGVCTLWSPDGVSRDVPVAEFVTGNHMNILRQGELLRSIRLPAAALRSRTAMRHMSLTKLGRSAALLVGTLSGQGAMMLTLTGATDRPVQLRFATVPDGETMRQSLAGIPQERWFQDVHGSAPYKRHVAHYFAEEIRAELEGMAA